MGLGVCLVGVPVVVVYEGAIEISLNLLDVETFESFAMYVIVLFVCGASMRIIEKHVKLNKSDFFGNVRRTDSEKIPPTARYFVRYVHGLL